MSRFPSLFSPPPSPAFYSQKRIIMGGGEAHQRDDMELGTNGERASDGGDTQKNIQYFFSKESDRRTKSSTFQGSIVQKKKQKNSCGPLLWLSCARCFQEANFIARGTDN